MAKANKSAETDAQIVAFEAYSVRNLPMIPTVEMVDLNALLGLADKLNDPILKIENAKKMDPKFNQPISDTLFTAHAVIHEGIMYIAYSDIKKEA